jgi:DNA-binding XRE family transcriptional regulator
MLENLQKLREMTGRGQHWLAAATGIERSKLSLFENGRVEPSKEE